MAITSTGFTFERTAELDERQNRVYKVQGRCRTDSPNDGPGTILAALVTNNIDIGSPYQEPTGYLDTGARCRKLFVRSDQDDPRTWLIDAEFGSAPPERTASGERGFEPSRSGNGQGEGRPRSPELRPAEVRWTFERNRKVLKRADIIDAETGETLHTDMPLQTSAGFPFDPLPEIDDSRPVLVYSRNELAYEPTIAQQYGDKVNSDTFWGFPPGSAKMAPPEAERVYESGLWYWRVTYKVEFRPVEPYWDIDILDAGFHAWEDGEVYRIKSRDGEPTDEPWPLDGEGAEADPAAEDFEPTYRRYRPLEYARTPFAPLNLV